MTSYSRSNPLLKVIITQTVHKIIHWVFALYTFFSIHKKVNMSKCGAGKYDCSISCVTGKYDCSISFVTGKYDYSISCVTLLRYFVFV